MVYVDWQSADFGPDKQVLTLPFPDGEAHGHSWKIHLPPARSARDDETGGLHVAGDGAAGVAGHFRQASL